MIILLVVSCHYQLQLVQIFLNLITSYCCSLGDSLSNFTLDIKLKKNKELTLNSNRHTPA